VAEQPPLPTETEYDPAEVTVMDWVVSPLLQVLPVALDDVRTTDPPWQKVVGPDVETVGVETVPKFKDVAADVTGPQFGVGEEKDGKSICQLVMVPRSNAPWSYTLSFHTPLGLTTPFPKLAKVVFVVVNVQTVKLVPIGL
jgi:hypothetical protein